MGDSLPDCNFFDHFRTLAERESSIGEEELEEIDSEACRQSEIQVEELVKHIEIEELETVIQELKKR